MTNKIEISRELAESLTRSYPAEITDQAIMQAIRIEALAALDELRALLAAPAVERQEPVSLPERSFVGDIRNPYRHTMLHDGYVSGWNAYQDAMVKMGPLYTSPPAPVAVVLPTLDDFTDSVEDIWGFGPDQLCMLNGEDLKHAWLACLDKVKEMNK